MFALIRSMTGYGRGEAVLHDRTITVEVRAVNNRYLDCAVKIPRLYVFAEEAIKAQVQSQVGRGKVDVFVTIDATAADKVAVTLNRPVADGYYAALTQMRETYDLAEPVSLSLLSRFPDVFLVEKEQGDADVIAGDILQVLSQALTDFNAMRAREGAKLADDVRAKAGTIASLVTQVEQRSPETVAAYREKLRQRMEEVLENTQIDESRILTEAALLPTRWPWTRDRPPAQPPGPAGGDAPGRGPHWPQAGLSHPGVQPGGQHHRLQVQRRGSVPGGGGPERGNRKNPRAGPKHRIKEEAPP